MNELIKNIEEWIFYDLISDRERYKEVFPREITNTDIEPVFHYIDNKYGGEFKNFSFTPLHDEVLYYFKPHILLKAKIIKPFISLKEVLDLRDKYYNQILNLWKKIRNE